MILVDRPPRLVLPFSLALGLTATLSARAAEVSVAITGLRGDLEEAARASLTLTQRHERDLTAAQVRSLFARGKEEIRRALEPYGYYNARVQGRLGNNAKGYRAQFDVTPGNPVTVSQSRVEVAGAAAQRPGVQ